MSLGLFYIETLTSGEGLSAFGLIGLPFLIGSLMLVRLCGMMGNGVVRVEADGYDGRLSTGFGPFGFTKRFSWRDVAKTVAKKLNDKPRRQAFEVLYLEDNRRIGFGSQLNDERRNHVFRSIETLLQELKR